jgi:hypothetical protein
VNDDNWIETPPPSVGDGVVDEYAFSGRALVAGGGDLATGASAAPTV